MGRGGVAEPVRRGSTGPAHLLRYLPAAVLATALVTAAPVLLIEAIAPNRGLAARAVGALVAGLLSIPVAAGAAALWRRQRWSRDVAFGDLLLWAWVRRYWNERRLARTLDLYECAKRAGPMVSIELLTGLARLLGARDPYTHGHGQRVARHAERIARAMRLSSAETARVCAAAAVHDVGKLFTPREILNKPGALTTAEFDRVKQHAADGAEMIEGVGDLEMAAMVRHHHERVDGRGYPDGLAGAEIPLGARIIAVADTFDAVISNRAYRSASTQKRALELLYESAGTQLDSVAVAAFGQRYRDRRPLAATALATAGAQRIFVALQAAAQGVGGIVPLLPAVGAAGVLGLSSGDGRATHAPAPARSYATTATRVSSSPTIAPSRAPRTAAPRAQRGHGPRGRLSPPSAAPRRSARAPLKGPATTNVTGISGSNAARSAPPTKTTPTLPAVPPPVNELPAPPKPPVPPPATVPSVPEVKVPSVPVSPVPAPSLPPAPSPVPKLGLPR